MNLKKKLLLAFTSVAVLLALVGGIASVALNRTVANYRHIAEVNLYGLKYIGEMYRAQKDGALAVDNLDDNNLAALPQYTRELAEANSHFEAAAKKYEQLSFGDEEKALWSETRVAYEKFLSLCHDMIKLSTSGRADERAQRDRIMQHTWMDSRAAFRAAAEKMIKFQESEAERWNTSAITTYQATVSSLFLLVLLGFGLAITMGYMLARGLSKQLSDIAHNLSEGAQRLATASQQISSSTERLSTSTSQQAAALQETSSSIEEMNQMVQRNAENAQRSSDTTNQSQASARRGNDSMTMMMQSVQEINTSNNNIKTQIEESNREIGEIIKVISEIGNKTKVINDIVFQTKLLAFNASVEAARAGEHGKGFAVVADEVGNLAQMSGNAAKEISSMLDGSIERVKRIITDTQSRVESLIASSKARVDSGNETAKQCSEALTEIVGSVTTVNSMVGEIATASREQAQGVGEITRAMAQMEQVTQSNAQATTELANAGRDLATQAGVLRGLVQALTRTVNGGGQAETAPPEIQSARLQAKPGTRGGTRRAA